LYRTGGFSRRRRSAAAEPAGTKIPFMTLAQPYWLLLLLLLPVLMYFYQQADPKRHVTLQVSRQSAMTGVKTWVVYARSWIQVLRWAAMVLIIMA